MISYGNNKCKIVSVSAADCVGVYAGNDKVFPSKIVYDETKIAVIELDSSYQPTENVNYFDTITEATNYMYQNYSGTQKYWLRVGSNVATQSGAVAMGAFPGICALTVLSGFSTIPDNAFKNNPSLKNVYFRGISTGIRNPFEGCSALTSLYLEGVETQPPTATFLASSYPFNNCNNIIDIHIKNFHAISNTVFYNLQSLKTIMFENVVIVSSNCTGSCENLESVKIYHVRDPQNTDIIGGDAFQGCTSLKTVEIYDPETIQETAFRGCNAIETITLNVPENSISGAPWGATNANVIWTG